MDRLKIIFMASDEMGASAILGIAKHHDIICLYTAKPSLERGKVCKNESNICAEYLNIPIRHARSFDDQSTKEEFIKTTHDIVIVVSYGKILPEYVLSSGKYRAVNLHPSALPKFRGAAPIERCVESGLYETEICTMYMSKELDAGNIISRHKIDIANDESASSLKNRIAKLSSSIILDALQRVQLGCLGEEQNHAEATYAKKIDKNELYLDLLNSDVLKIYNKIRAMTNHGFCRFKMHDIQIKIIKSEYEIHPNIQSPGFIDDKLTLYCINGLIKPKIIRKDGSRDMLIEDFLRGWRKI